jgi:ketose-bisphosphate aldolases
MAYEKVRDLLEIGKQHNASILAFDALNVDTIAAVVQGAEIANKPVIVMLYPGMRNIMPFGVFAETAKYYAKRAKVPVALHLDHCSDFDMILEAIHEGFDSVMADGSVLPFEENLEFTKSVVRVAKNFDVDVEGELGHVGDAASGDSFSRKEFFTRPDEVKTFVEQTGVSSLAVSFGSAHGLYKSTPKLDIEHLRELDKATDIPLVLHGGSGIPDDQLAEAFASGINKINIGTEFFNLHTKLAGEFYAKDFTQESPFASPAYIQPPLAEYVARRLALCKVKL